MFVLDAAQTAGVVTIDMNALNVGALVFSGHKGLLATQGAGGFIIRDDYAERMEPIISGGTGSFSDSVEIPRLLPDKFEAGTLNLPGIAALNESIKFLQANGIENIRKNENYLYKVFCEKMIKISGVRLVGYDETNISCAVAALDFPGRDNGVIAGLLDERYGIMTRSGLHCAPLTHKALGTFPAGAVRCSFGYTNTTNEVEILLNALMTL